MAKVNNASITSGKLANYRRQNALAQLLKKGEKNHFCSITTQCDLNELSMRRRLPCSCLTVPRYIIILQYWFFKFDLSII